MAFHPLHRLRARLSTALLALSVVLGGAGVASAESDWPTGPVTVIMHTKAGGSSDVFIRTLAESLEPEIGQPIIVVNAPGAGGANQMNRIRAAEPDGQTIGINTLTHFTSMLTNLKGTFSLDDFSWIASAQEDEIIFFARSDSELNSLADMVKKAKETGGAVNVGGFGPVGSMQNIGMSMLEDAAGVKFNWVAFESTPDIMSALLGGHVDVGISNLGSTLSFFESDRIKGLGVLGKFRLSSVPDLPTFTEQGYDVDNSWVQVRGVFGPKGIPMETREKIAAAFHKAMKSPSYQAYARNAGVMDSWMGPAAYTAFTEVVSTVAKRQLKTAGVIQ